MLPNSVPVFFSVVAVLLPTLPKLKPDIIAFYYVRDCLELIEAGDKGLCRRDESSDYLLTRAQGRDEVVERDTQDGTCFVSQSASISGIKGSSAVCAMELGESAGEHTARVVGMLL